ncbi:hypothetical protein AVEN_221511-1 [Araneus ventricosus]|uniref:Uncharacterized protein n=1 Tax=Araneus ventricosus TaxID=182803 RepID=A0A4Y2E340_ARAVE|nr:hypothetical protein AVEN_221511-1 [Araneus ventricosus]
MSAGIFEAKKDFFSMKTSLLAFLLMSLISQNDSTILAATGYIASTSPVRNFLISSGIGNLVTYSANSLYDASGFRFVSDQGTRIRKAVVKNYTLVEVGSNGSFMERRGENLIPGRGESDERRIDSERLFGVLNKMDKNTCISKLLCEIGAKPISFGSIGLKINTYIKSVPPVTWNSATFPYIEAFQAGSTEGVNVCRHYSGCTYDLNRIVYFLWGIINPIRV